MLRLVIRLWREVRDGVRAGTAKWDARWAASEGHTCKLAQRLTFGAGGSAWATEEGWQVRALFVHNFLRKDARRIHVLKARRVPLKALASALSRQ